jgi:hypothetical protein
MQSQSGINQVGINNILLYSKYSQFSINLIEIVNKYQVPLLKLCVDNKNIRQKISSSKQIKINYVPCILSLYSDGKVEQYEGENAFQWVLVYVEKLAKELSEKQSNIVNIESNVMDKQINTYSDSKNSKKGKISKKQVINETDEESVISNDSEELEEIEKIQNNKSKLRKNKVGKKLDKKEKKVVKFAENTPIEALDVIDSDIEPTKILNDDFEDERDTKSKELPIKTNSLMQAAMEMQKLRETDAEKENKNMNIPIRR